MQRRTKDLDCCRRRELRYALSAYAVQEVREEMGGDVRREERGDVEAGGDCERIAEGEEEEGWAWHWAGSHGRKQLGEVRVLPEAEGEVCEGGGGELGGAVRRGGGWLVADGGGGGIDCVGGEVRACV